MDAMLTAVSPGRLLRVRTEGPFWPGGVAPGRRPAAGTGPPQGNGGRVKRIAAALAIALVAAARLLGVAPGAIAAELDTIPQAVLDKINAAVGPQRNDPASGLKLTLNAPNAVYREGDFAIFEVTAPRSDSYIYLDYYQLDGNVIHILPDPDSFDKKFRASRSIVVGAPDSSVRYEILPPFGRELLVVMAAREPLLDKPRREFEDAGYYLEALRAGIAGLEQAGRGGSLSVLYRFITTYPEGAEIAAATPARETPPEPAPTSPAPAAEPPHEATAAVPPAPAPEVKTAPEPEPEPAVAVAPEPEPAPEAKTALAPRPEPAATPPPEPVVAAAPEPEPEPAPKVETAAAPPPEPAATPRPEPMVAAAAPEPEAAPAPPPEPIAAEAPPDAAGAPSNAAGRQQSAALPVAPPAPSPEEVKYRKRIGQLLKRMQRAPNDVENLGALVSTYQDYALVLVEKGDYEKATRSLAMATALDPTNSGLADLARQVETAAAIERNYEEGRARLAAGETDLAYEAFQRVLALDPDHAEARKQATELAPAVTKLYHKRALVAFRRQDLDRALELWDKLLAIDPNHQKAKLNRLMVLDLKERLQRLRSTQ